MRNNANNKNATQGIEVRIPEPLENVKLPSPELLNFYQDLERRVFWLIGPVDDSLYNLVQYIINWNLEDRGLPTEERKPIRIIIASGGGDLEIEKTLNSIIEFSATPVYGIAIGICASAASMIYLSCHKRFALPNATFVFHQGSCENLGGTYQQVISFMENYERDIMAMSVFYKSHTNYDDEFIDNKLATGDWYINSEEALEHGIIHELVQNLDIYFKK